MADYEIMEKPRIEGVTKHLAETFAKMEACPNDRVLNERRVIAIKKIVKDDRFRVAEWCSCFCEQTQKEYRVNGKHTSNAFLQLFENGAHDKVRHIKVVLTKYRAKTLEGMARLYASFDSKISLRSSADIYQVYAKCDSRLDGIAKQVISICVAGVGILAKGEQAYHHMNADERGILLLDKIDFVLFVQSTLMPGKDGGDARHMRRSPVISAMLSTYEKASQKAEEFWREVRDASGATRECPSRMLNSLLVQSAVAHGRGAMGLKKTMSWKEMYAKCIYAWNNWRQGKLRVQSLRYMPDTDSPKAR